MVTTRTSGTNGSPGRPVPLDSHLGHQQDRQHDLLPRPAQPTSWHYWFTSDATITVNYTIPNSLPTTGAVSGFPANFHYGVWFNISATVSDADGYANISYWHLLVNYGVDGSYACYLLLTHNGNYIQLLNDAATVWSGAYTMGSATYPANSQCQTGYGE